MSERLDITRPLKLRGGSEVRGVQELPQPWAGNKEYALGGLRELHNGEWCFETWMASGQFSRYGDNNPLDLVYADEPEPEAKPDDMAAILDRLHQIEQRLGDIVAKATDKASQAKGCPFERLDAWAKADPRRYWTSCSYRHDDAIDMRAYGPGLTPYKCVLWSNAPSTADAAEALCRQLGI